MNYVHGYYFSRFPQIKEGSINKETKYNYVAANKFHKRFRFAAQQNAHVANRI